MRLIHIVPHVPPHFDAVGSYAAVLAHRLASLAADPAESAMVVAGWRPQVDPPRNDLVRDLSGRCDATALVNTVRALGAGVDARVIVHYVGYGYAPRGWPGWLVRGVDRIRREGMRTVTIFHELYANGPPWTSAFWLSVPMRRAAVALARGSDQSIVTRDAAAAWVRQQAGLSTSVAVFPVHSNVGEPAQCRAWALRPPQAVVLGSLETKRGVYARADAIASALRAAGVEELLDIGPPPTSPPSFPGLRVIVRGFCPADVTSQALSDARVGLLAYPPAFLGKSGIFAAYLAHGVVPLQCLADAGAPPEGQPLLRVSPSGALPSDAALDELSASAFAWYASRAHSTRLASFIGRWAATRAPSSATT
jgi:hypothetical protein